MLTPTTDVLQWMSQNRVVLLEVLFGGAGVAIVGFLVRLFLLRQGNGSSQRQTSGDSSTNLQSGRDINLGERGRDDDEGT